MIKIINIDDKCLNAEDMAMLQALYSRSSKSVMDHISENRHLKSGEFMKKYYVNYGHESIAECGTTTFFIEGVSFVAAKCIQNNPLYRGQETSSRYIDFRNSDRVCTTKDVERIQDELMKLYDMVESEVYETYVNNENFTEMSVRAFAFDVARGYLPAGCKAQLSWTTDLRNLRKNLARLKGHWLKEIREVGDGLAVKAQELFPNSMDGLKPKEYVNDLYRLSSLEENIYDIGEKYRMQIIEGDIEDNQWLQSFGMINIDDWLDYGSWRDIQRHRRGYIHFVYPLPKAYGMSVSRMMKWIENSFYIKAVCPQYHTMILEKLQYIFGCLHDMEYQDAVYGYPLMTPVPFQASWSIPELFYVLKLRSQKTVHPSLRELIRKIQNMALKAGFGRIGDFDPIAYEPVKKRGKQTIYKEGVALPLT